MKPGVTFGGLAAILLVLVLAAVAGSFAYLDMPLGALFTGAAAGEAVAFVQRFFPPDLSADFLAKVGGAALEEGEMTPSGPNMKSAHNCRYVSISTTVEILPLLNQCTPVDFAGIDVSRSAATTRGSEL